MKDENNVYIGRRGVVFIDKKRFPESSSRFANPFKVGRDGTREEVLVKYRAWMEDQLRSSETLRAELCLLKGKTLGCWCCPEKCHGDILLEFICREQK